MKDLEFTFECTPEFKEKIKKGSKDCSLSESQFIAVCIEFFFYKKIILAKNIKTLYLLSKEFI